MDNKSFYLALLGLFVLFYLLLGISKARGEEKQMTTCRLASHLLEGDTRICIFVGANHTHIESMYRMMQENVQENISVLIDQMKNLLI